MNEQNIKIVSEKNFGFAIYFDPFDCSIQVFEKRGLNPSGQIWEQLVEKYCLEYDMTLNDVEFDSESDEFVAYSKNKKELQKITQTLSDLIKNEILLDNFLDQLSCDDFSSFPIPEVFISNLEMNLDAFAYTNHNLTINDPI
ncbi:MAG: hypothetical protein KDI92_13055, partial [Xanthomonadales bacterium]|nr:hypothetical protein [Xanthomonadales bacterium]